MKTSYIFKIKNKNNISLYDTLPKINLNTEILRTSPNIKLEKNTKHYKYIPKINRTIFNESITNKKNINKRYKPSRTIDMVRKLNIESNIREIFLDELKKEEARERINNSKEITERRLGLIKDTEIDSEEEKNKEKDIKNFDERSIEKLNNKEKEKKVEKNYKQSIKDLQITEETLSKLDKEIAKLTEKIDGHKLEINILDNYGKSIDKKNILLESPVKKIKKRISIAMREIPQINTENTERRPSQSKKKNFETEAKLIVKGYQRKEKENKIKKEVDNEEKKLEILLKEKEDLEEKSFMIKKRINDLKNELINIYHTTLYEGLDFRGEGLARIILNIWNLGVNIDMNFIPSYLDKKSVEFLFKKAKQIIDMSKIKKLIEECEKDFVDSLKQWKKENNLSLNSNKDVKSYFFKTKINHDIDNNSFLECYPMTKIFMNNYKRRNENEFEKDEKYDTNLLKNWEIPKIIIEKNQKIEKVKYLQQVLKNQIEMEGKNEVIRLCKEFLFNSYEEKYKVCIETIIGALYGEIHKDDMLNFYYRLKKENKDNLKKIEFYSPLSERKKK